MKPRLSRRKLWVAGLGAIGLAALILKIALIGSNGKILLWAKTESVCSRCGKVWKKSRIEVLGDMVRDKRGEPRETPISKSIYYDQEDQSFHEFLRLRHRFISTDTENGIVRQSHESAAMDLVSSGTLGAALEVLNKEDRNRARQAWFWLAYNSTGTSIPGSAIERSIIKIIDAARTKDRAKLLHYLKQVKLSDWNHELSD